MATHTVDVGRSTVTFRWLSTGPPPKPEPKPTGRKFGGAWEPSQSQPKAKTIKRPYKPSQRETERKAAGVIRMGDFT